MGIKVTHLNVAVALVMVVLLSRILSTPPSAVSNDIIQKMAELIGDARRLFTTARQDSNIIWALIHSTQALTKSELVARFVSREDALNYLNVDIDDMLLTLRAYQQKVLLGVDDAKLFSEM